MTKIFLAIAAMTLLTSCKKDSGAASKVDPNAVDVAKTEEVIPDPEPNIGPPPMPADAAPARAVGKYPIMSFEKLEHDFGLIYESDKVSYNFKFTNTGTSNLIISNAVGSCGCTVPEYPKEPVRPGESGVMKVSFNSAGKGGQQQKTVTIAVNTEKRNEVLTIKAMVKPRG